MPIDDSWRRCACGNQPPTNDGWGWDLQTPTVHGHEFPPGPMVWCRHCTEQLSPLVGRTQPKAPPGCYCCGLCSRVREFASDEQRPFRLVLTQPSPMALRYADTQTADVCGPCAAMLVVHAMAHDMGEEDPHVDARDFQRGIC